jgi:Na+/H+ antiporter NhaC
MTRGVIAMLHAQPGLAMAYNPASPLVIVAALAVVVRAGVGRLTGRWLDLRLRPTRMFWLLAAILLLLLWVDQQRHAALLLT